MDNLRGVKVAILVTDGFEQDELVKPRKSWPSLKTDLRNAGAEWIDSEAAHSRCRKIAL